MGSLALILTIALSLALGIHGWQFAWFVPACFLVIVLSLVPLEMRFCPPPLEPFDPNARHWG